MSDRDVKPAKCDVCGRPVDEDGICTQYVDAKQVPIRARDDEKKAQADGVA